MTTDYMSGFGNEFATEAVAGALPQGRNSPQQPAFGLYAEQLSGSAFTAPRGANRRSWLYRMRPIANHAAFHPVDKEVALRSGPFSEAPADPNRLIIRLYTRGIPGKDPQTAYSFTVTFKLADNPDELFAGNTIGTCNQKEIPADAKGIVSMTWDQANNYPSILERIKKK